ncbi:MAG TPA: hypothetical protein VK502_04515 [Candidatus Saccharimonadales bacterium]|nr:hypothetical protein [Candidatus Saccharimonadales bacterium]
MSAQTGMPADRQLLDDVVDALIRRHNIVKDDLTCEFQGEVVPWNVGWAGGIEQIALAKAKTMAAETLARLIYAEPKADLYGVHCGTWLGKYESGPLLLQQIAASAIVCRIRAKLGVTSGVREHYDVVTA